MSPVVMSLNTTRTKVQVGITLLICIVLVIFAVAYREQNGLVTSIVVGVIAAALALFVLANLPRAFGKRALVIDAEGVRVKDRYGFDVPWAEGTEVMLLQWYSQMKRVQQAQAGLRFFPGGADAEFGKRHRYLRRHEDGSYNVDLPADVSLAELDAGLRHFGQGRYRGWHDLGRNTATGEA